MEDIEASQAKLETKLTQLSIHANRTEDVLQSKTPEAIERHLGALRTTISEADNFKRELEALKIDAKQDLGEIGTWNAGVDLQLAKGEGEVGRLREWLTNRKREEVRMEREDRLKF